MLEGKKTALVTGAGRGIGRAIALRLARDGARVAVHYGSSADEAQRTVADIHAAGGQAFSIQAHLEEIGSISHLWAQFDALADGLDILVNSAGVLGRRCPIDQVTPSDLDQLFSVNVRAPFLLTQSALPRLRDGGRIVNISTVLTRGTRNPELLPYVMSKAAMDTFTATLAKQLGSRRITVNAVGPGVTATAMNAARLADPETHARLASLSPLNRVAEPDDIADIVAFLASDDARWLTGQWLDASGGALL